VLVIGGLGFGTSSMPQLLSAQHGVSWQQRGIVTSAVQFFRTMGGAIGIGLLGMLFNVLAAPQMQELRKMGVSPATIMDPRSRESIPAAAKPIIHTMIDSGLTWVFLAMAVIAALQIVVSWLMASDDDHPAATEVEPFEALPG
jgi:hypothetical protein